MKVERTYPTKTIGRGASRQGCPEYKADTAICRAVVSESFRSELARLVPQLGDKPAHWRFASYLLFPSNSEPSKCRTLVPQSVIYQCLGGKGNYSALSRVREFSEKIWPVELSGWIYGWFSKEDECRYVKSMTLPAGVSELVQKELTTVATGTERLVFLDDGSSFTSRSQKIQRDILNERANNVDLLANCGCSEAWEVLNYLNNLAPNRFTKILSHLEEAVKEAASHRDSKNQLTLLKMIEHQSKPYYKPVSRSTRIFSMNASILRLAGPVRRILTQDWVQADLASCQLAVVSATWDDGIAAVKDYLIRRKLDPQTPSIWVELCDHMGIEFSEEHKRILKNALYSICFGQGRKRSVAYFADEFPDLPGAWSKFTSHTVISALLDARKREFKRIKKQGYGVDAFGNKVHPTLNDEGKNNWPSVLAVCAQSYELALLHPIVKLASARSDKRGFSILMWLHDGFSFQAHSVSDKEYWKQKIQSLVDDKARALGIPTWLEV